MPLVAMKLLVCGMAPKQGTLIANRGFDMGKIVMEIDEEHSTSSYPPSSHSRLFTSRAWRPRPGLAATIFPVQIDMRALLSGWLRL